MCRPSSCSPWPPPRREIFSRAPTWSFLVFFPLPDAAVRGKLYLSGKGRPGGGLRDPLRGSALRGSIRDPAGSVRTGYCVGAGFPAVSLMSMVTLPGGFLHRQDALMVGVWFFTLFALICSSMYYSCQCLEKLFGKKVPGRESSAKSGSFFSAASWYTPSPTDAICTRRPLAVFWSGFSGT